MTININQLRERLSHRFPGVEQVDESVVRFTREAGGQTFAQYYVDVGLQLPTSPDALISYQDRVIGKRYFDGRKSLQWSNYLYFIVSDKQAHTSEVQDAREWIEQDRTYARKFVIPESDLDTAFEPTHSLSSAALPEANILSVWLGKLAEAGLDKAVVSEGSLPNRLSLIEAASSNPAARSKPSVPRGSAKELPLLTSLQLTKFRDFPVTRHFDFGDVNLIVGPNGTGKTSLLEAIELLYCGRNKRNANADDAYSLIAAFSDGSKETATRARPAKIFRQRNLDWYGQAEVKTNNLFVSFGLFNFLDTDAAVGLADSTERIEEDLSKLLIGSEASKTWREIDRVHKAVTTRLRELQPLEVQIKDEISAIDNRLKEAGSVKQESDSILTRIEDMLRRLKWSVSTKENAALPALLLESLPELESVAQQAAAFEWAESPASFEGLGKYSTDAKALCDKASRDTERLEEHRKKARRASENLRTCQAAAMLIIEATRVVKAGLPSRAGELRKQQIAAAAEAGLLAGLDDTVRTKLAKARPDATVAAYVNEAKTTRMAAQKAAQAAKEEYASFTRLRDRSVVLAQQLRDIAAQILQDSPASEECPLCHTHFAPGELAKHMRLGVDQHIEASGQVLLSQLHQREEELREAVLVESASSWLSRFCEQMEIEISVTVRDAVLKSEGVRHSFAETEKRVEALRNELGALESQGLAVGMMEQILEGLRDSGYVLSALTEEAINQVRIAIERDQASAAKTLNEERAVAEPLQRALEASLGVAQSTAEDLKAAVSRLKERQAVADSLRAKLASLFKSFPWPADRALSELVVESESLRKVAAEFQAAVGRERQAKTILADSTNRKESLVEKLADISPRIERLAKAETSLDGLQKKHSLTLAMTEAIKQNRAGIEAIFGRIHAPAEFSGLGESLSTLVRKNGSTTATLSEISTGQRAAFALSIFLAQNAQLRTAPPVVLIDDPIAHVDDLNALSFLDYLREIALDGKRQIFFATASEKLATLFQRKFDFLGENFRRYDLRR